MKRILCLFILIFTLDVFSSTNANAQAAGAMWYIAQKIQRQKQVEAWNKKYWQGPIKRTAKIEEWEWILLLF